MSAILPDEDTFLKEFQEFHSNRGTQIKNRVFNRMDFNFYRVFQAVLKHGGFAYVEKNNLWRSVALQAGMPLQPNTVALFAKHYIQTLLPFERVRILHLPDKLQLNDPLNELTPESGTATLLSFLQKQTPANEHPSVQASSTSYLLHRSPQNFSGPSVISTILHFFSSPDIQQTVYCFICFTLPLFTLL